MSKCTLCDVSAGVMISVNGHPVCQICAEEIISDLITNMNELMPAIDKVNEKTNKILCKQNILYDTVKALKDEISQLEDDTCGIMCMAENIQESVSMLAGLPQPTDLHDDVKVIFDTLKPGTPAYEAALRIQKQLGD